MSGDFSFSSSSERPLDRPPSSASRHFEPILENLPSDHRTPSRLFSRQSSCSLLGRPRLSRLESFEIDFKVLPRPKPAYSRQESFDVDMDEKLSFTTKLIEENMSGPISILYTSNELEDKSSSGKSSPRDHDAHSSGFFENAIRLHQSTQTEDPFLRPGRPPTHAELPKSDYREIFKEIFSVLQQARVT